MTLLKKVFENSLIILKLKFISLLDDESYMDDAVNEIDNSVFSLTMCMTE